MQRGLVGGYESAHVDDGVIASGIPWLRTGALDPARSGEKSRARMIDVERAARERFVVARCAACRMPDASGRIEHHSAAVFKVDGAAHEAKHLAGDFDAVPAGAGAPNDLFRNGRGDGSVKNQQALVSRCVADVHRAGRVALLHHDEALAGVQWKLEIFGQAEK